MPFIEIICIDGSKKLINVSMIDYIEDKAIIVGGKRISCIETYEEIKDKFVEHDRRLLS